MREYVPIFFDWTEVTEELNDQEKGRLIDAIVLYAQGGDWQERIKGNERYLFPAFRKQIDRGNDGSENKRKAALERENQKRAQKAQTSTKSTNEHKKHNLHEEEEEDKPDDGGNTCARDEDLPLGLTPEDITAAIDRDETIEAAARDAGLPVSETAMVWAREMADQYGIDKVVEAIRETALRAQRPGWKYVDGVLEGRGKRNDNRGNSGENRNSYRGDYSFLTDLV